MQLLVWRLQKIMTTWISLQYIIRDVNDVIDKGFIEIEGKNVDIEIYLGGDYKVNK
jgi:hypothetical protein